MNTLTSIREQRAWVRHSPSGFTAEVVARPAKIETEWRNLEARGVTTVFQRFDWVDAYCRHVLPHRQAEPAIVLGRLDGNPAFILPLAVSTVGPVRSAGWIGGNHSGYNFGLWSREAAAAVARMTRAEVEKMLGTALAGVDCAVLGRMPRVFDGIAQPLGALSSIASPTEGYSFGLEGGFCAVLARTDGSSRRKKVAAKQRKMGEAGSFQCGTLRDPVRAHAALDFFAEQKALRLAEQGLPSSFAQPGVMDFFHDLLNRSKNLEEPLLEMAELSVGGQTRAVTGCGIHHGRANLYFTTFVRDELTCNSPGQILLFRTIEDSCARKMSSFDFGVGYEDFKTHWCDTTHELADAHVAFTALGAAAVAAVRLSHATKDRMRRNEPLWRHLKSAQAYLTRRNAARVA